MWRNVVNRVFNVFHRVIPQVSSSSVMERVHLRLVDGEETFDLHLKHKFQESEKVHTFNFTRLQNEALSKTLERMQASLAKKGTAKLKKKAKKNPEAYTEPEPIVVNLLKGDEPWDNSVAAKLAWTSPDSSLLVEGTKYEIFRNPPKVKSLKLSACLIAGYAVAPFLDVEFVVLNKCLFHWYRQVIESDYTIGDTDSRKRRRSDGCGEVNYEWVQTGFIYTPKNTDVGRKLKIVCIPSDGNNNGLEYECISKTSVILGPLNCPFEHRHNLTKTLCGENSFRVVSYNVLADVYADSEFSRNYLFPHCPRDKLEMGYRKYLIMREVQGYNADIICLQEVDRKIFESDMLPILSNEGYDGFHCVKHRNHLSEANGQGESEEELTECQGELEVVKMSPVKEGVATFFRKSKFRLLKQFDTNVTEVLKKDEALWTKISSNIPLTKSLKKRTTVVQVSLLENIDNDKKVLVATTHFYFHPRANNVRLLQALGCVKHIQAILDMYKGQQISVILCGDLNAAPINAVHELITKGKVKGSHADWYSEGKSQYIPNMDIETGLTFKSACGYPRYTNYVPAFHGCLDYIYVGSSLMTQRVIPLPSHEEVSEFTALPNEVFPSDHLALVCDLTWAEGSS